MENLPLKRMDDYEFYEQNFVKKSKSGKVNTSKSVEQIETSSNISENENDLDSTDRSMITQPQTNGDTNSHVDSFVANNAQIPEK